MTTTVVISAYEAAWPAAFAAIGSELRRVLDGVPIEAIEHVGSTSVPGLAAKPIIDVDVVVGIGQVAAAVDALEAAGYEYRGMQGVPDRHVLRSGAGVPRHVYVLVEGSLALRNHRAVREVLRTNPSLRRRYGDAKRRFAGEGMSRERYGTAKSTVLGEILAEAGFTPEERAAIDLAHLPVTARRVGNHVHVGDRRLQVEVTGAEDAAPVLLAHSGPGLSHDLDDLRDILAGMGHTVVRWDHEPGDVVSIGDYTCHMEAVRRTVIGGPCRVIGHSLGADLAVHYAFLYSTEITALLHLCGIGLEWWPEYSHRHKEHQRTRLGPDGARFEELRRRQRTPEEESEFRMLYLRSELRDPGDAALATQLLEAESHFPVDLTAYGALADEMKRLDFDLLKSRCRAVTVPVLVARGEHDPRPDEAVDSLIEALPDARRETIAGAGHWPWADGRDGLVDLLRQVHNESAD